MMEPEIAVRMPPGRGVSRRPVVIVPASVRESKLVQSSATSELKEAPGPKGAEHAQGIDGDGSSYLCARSVLIDCSTSHE